MYLLAFATGGLGADEELTGSKLATQLRRMNAGTPIIASQNNWGPGLAAMRSADGGINFEGASGPLDFDASGEARSSIEAWYFDVGNGRVASHGVLLTAVAATYPWKQTRETRAWMVLEPTLALYLFPMRTTLRPACGALPP